jgi:ornithine decarboxylase
MRLVGSLPPVGGIASPTGIGRSLRSPTSSAPTSPANQASEVEENGPVEAAVLRAAREHIKAGGANFDDPFFTVDLRLIAAKFKRMAELLPRVQPFYTMKCHPDVRVFELLTGLGCGVDCASKPEIEFSLAHGVSPDKIIYANTMKQTSHLIYARESNMPLMTFDSLDELAKVQRVFPAAQLVLRIKVDDSKARSQFGPKFGVEMSEVPGILETAQRLNVNIIGVCFHAGVGILDASAFADAIARAKEVFTMAEGHGFQFTLLNIGGGFAGDDHGPVTLDDAATAVNTALDEHFPESSGVRIISEPGRFYVSASTVLHLNVVGRKVDPALRERALELDAAHPNLPRYMYILNDGMHGSFNTPHLIKLHTPAVLKAPFADKTSKVPCSLWGPTMDGKDMITAETELPVLDVGDWISIPHMGAYTFATGSTFNGFTLPVRIYLEDTETKTAEESPEAPEAKD